ncbi:MAG: hypothetical protein Q8J88_00350 [Bacteroidales bacterium]|nr:hypothetical protein [Bacteroidales bacterium]
MTNEKKIKQTSTTILILSLVLVTLKYLGLWVEGFTGMIIVLFAGLTGMILLWLLVVRIVTIFKARNKNLFIPFIIGIIAIWIVIFEPFENLKEKYKSPVVLSGYCEHTVTTVGLSLRQDKSFEYNAGAFLSKEIYYGNYNLSRDTLILNFKNKQPVNITKKLVFINNGLQEIGDTSTHRHFFKITLNKLKE